MAIDGIDESSRTRVYRRIFAQLSTDPVLSAAGVEWIAHDGVGEIVRPNVVDVPVIVLSPRLGPMQRRGPEGWKGGLVVDVEMYVPNSTDVCDCLDLWTAFEDALYAWNDRDKQRKFEADLRGERCGCGGPCDAETGEVAFDQPATISPEFDRNDNFVFFHCRGSISVSILRTINP